MIHRIAIRAKSHVVERSRSEDEIPRRNGLATNTHRLSRQCARRLRLRVNIRFPSKKSETGLSVSRPTRSKGCHPRQWNCGPSRLRYAPARITISVSLFLPPPHVAGADLFVPLCSMTCIFPWRSPSQRDPRCSEVRGVPLSGRH